RRRTGHGGRAPVIRVASAILARLGRLDHRGSGRGVARRRPDGWHHRGGGGGGWEVGSSTQEAKQSFRTPRGSTRRSGRKREPRSPKRPVGRSGAGVLSYRGRLADPRTPGPI